MQVNYGDTVQKLSKFQTNIPTQLTYNETNNKSNHSTTLNPSTQLKLAQYQEVMNNNIVHEKALNERKRLYNREIGRKAVINEVLPAITF